jgi:hypothetical protein
MEAFHDAAAENFPSEVIVPELHEAPVRATWVAFPPGPRRKFYKKYTHVFEVEITPQVAASVTTFGGTTLAAVLRDQLGVVPPVRARVHVYQAISGTTLPRIAYFERRVPGLGGMRPRVAATQLHPLTVQAATAILHHPRLGRDVAGQFLSSRELTTLGQRFYYLEIAGARPIAVTGGLALRSTAVRRTSQVNVTLDFPKDEFRVFVYLSEAEAQEVAAKIRQHDVAAVVVLAKRVYEAGVNVALGGDIRRHVKILTEAMPQEQFLGLDLRFIADRVKRRLAKKVVEWVDIALSAYLKGSVGEFVAAADDPADGVTIVVRIMHPPGASLVRRLLRGDVGIATIKDAVKAFEGSPSYDVKTVAGFRFD